MEPGKTGASSASCSRKLGYRWNGPGGGGMRDMRSPRGRGYLMGHHPILACPDLPAAWLFVERGVGWNHYGRTGACVMLLIAFGPFLHVRAAAAPADGERAPEASAG